MIWYTRKNEQEQIEIYRPHDHGTIVSEIWCHDDEDRNIQASERKIIQEFIDQVVQNNKSIITGLFCEKYIDDVNKRNIEKKINISDEKLIKKNKKRQKKKMPEIHYYYLKKININWNLFEIAPWDFSNIAIWKKSSFVEECLLEQRPELTNDRSILCTFSVVELDSIWLYILDELAEYRDNLFKELQNLGYQIVETKHHA